MDRRMMLAGLGVGLTAGCLRTVGYRGDSPTSGTDAYHIDDLETTSSTERPAVRYILRPRAFYSADAVDRKREREGDVDVADISELEPRVREAIETAIHEDDWRTNHLPEGLAETVERYDFFTGATSGTHTHVGLELFRFDPDAPPAIAFDATATDNTVEPGDPGALEFSLHNMADDPREIFAGTVPPFGVVVAEAVTGNDQFLLWRNYTEEGCVGFTDDGIVQCAIGTITELGPGESVTRRYEVLHDGTAIQPDYTRPPGPGSYQITHTLSHSLGDGAPSSTLSLDVGFTLRQSE